MVRMNQAVDSVALQWFGAPLLKRAMRAAGSAITSKSVAPIQAQPESGAGSARVVRLMSVRNAILRMFRLLACLSACLLVACCLLLVCWGGCRAAKGPRPALIRQAAIRNSQQQ